MKTFLLSLCIFLTSIPLSQAQQIDSRKVLGGYKYSRNGLNMNLNQLRLAMSENPEASLLINQARTSNVLGSIFGGVGGFMVGFTLGTALSPGNNEPNWAVAGIGAGLIVVSIPFSVRAGKKSKEAVDVYNASLGDMSYVQKPEWQLIATGNGLGLSLRF